MLAAASLWIDQGAHRLSEGSRLVLNSAISHLDLSTSRLAIWSERLLAIASWMASSRDSKWPVEAGSWAVTVPVASSAQTAGECPCAVRSRATAAAGTCAPRCHSRPGRDTRSAYQQRHSRDTRRRARGLDERPSRSIFHAVTCSSSRH
jgi:hypothetical protein